MNTKICRVCGEEKPLSDFHFRKDTQKHRNDCICCISKVNKAYRDTHKEERKVYDQNRRLTHGDEKAAQEKAWREANPERVSENKRNWYQDNREDCLVKARQHYADNKDDPVYMQKRKDRERKHRLDNPGQKLESCRRRSASKKQAIPSWDIDNEDSDKFFKYIYIVSASTTRLSGIKHHVDHIIPLGGRNTMNEQMVCGLHTPANLQIIPAKDNLTKGSYTWPDMWEIE